ncbi:MAG TPA: DUF4340 domain-containing protein [Planctomycetaceae bacterium]|nr:DUF4340 domain-containing protein [Planctomycetaceae bacterium]
MNQTRQTVIFVGVAAALAGVAVATHLSSRVPANPEFERVGAAFFEEFEDPNSAASLRVVSYDEDEARLGDFHVEYQNGLWRIPSHHRYPADAKDRLAKAAASLIGVTRDALASRRETEHERFGVIDPQTEDRTQFQGLGQRITVQDAGGRALADLIIGKKVEGQDGYYYVRRPDEKETYRARLEIDLSTRFADWIEQDLLKTDRWNAVKLVVTKPAISEEGRIIDRERVDLSRPDTAGQWSLAGLNEQTEEVNRTAVDSLLRALDELQIVGVRPKPRGITADFRLDTEHLPPELAKNPLLIREVQNALLTDLERRGFSIGLDVNGEPRVYSREGEVLLATNDGVAYHIHLGDLFTGSLEEIEVGGAKSEDGDGAKPAAAAAADGEAGDDAAAASPNEGQSDAVSELEGGAGTKPAQGSSDGKLHRYVFVRAQLDPAVIGPEPVKPEEPANPEGLDDEPAAKPDAPGTDGTQEPQSGAGDDDAADSPDESQPADTPPAAPPGDEAAASPPGDADGNGQPADEPSDAEAGAQEAGESPETPAAASPDPAKSAADDPAKRRAEYNAAVKQYEARLSEYERKKSDYDRKVKEGQDKVEGHNRRFRDWYYVISGASLENLKIARSDLVKPKAVEPPDGDAGASPGPVVPNGGAQPADDPAGAGSAPPADAQSPPAQPAQPADGSAGEPAPDPASPAPATPGAAGPSAAADSDARHNAPDPEATPPDEGRG